MLCCVLNILSVVIICKRITASFEYFLLNLKLLAKLRVATYHCLLVLKVTTSTCAHINDRNDLMYWLTLCSKIDKKKRINIYVYVTTGLVTLDYERLAYLTI